MLSVLAALGTDCTAQVPRLLTSIGEVHHLPPASARQQLQARLSGSVTAAFPDLFFLQEGSEAIAVHASGAVDAGDRVELTGITVPGPFATELTAREVRILGRGPLPAAPLMTAGELYGGRHDSQLVTIRGIVQAAQLAPSRTTPHGLTLQVDLGGPSASVELTASPVADPASLVDAEVILRGVCATHSNSFRQFNGLRILVDRAGSLTVKRRPLTSGWSLLPAPVSSVLQFASPTQTDHRVRLAGTLTFADGVHAVLQDASGAIRVQTDRPVTLPVGSPVEILGFPALLPGGPGGDTPALVHGTLRAVPGLSTLAPTMLKGRELDSPSYPFQDHLIRLKAVVLDEQTRGDSAFGLYRAGNTVFYSLWPNALTHAKAPAKGSIVTVTGILRVHTNPNSRMAAYQILLRTPGDVAVLSRPPWLGSRHVVWALLALLACLLWVGLLRLRVRQQTELLRESEERFRQQAQRDSLTGVASRAYLQERLHDAIYSADRHGSTLGVLMIDLDHFKRVNDTLGHHTGDELLRVVADRLRHSVRRSDLVARLGGDEFLVLLPELAEPEDAQLVSAKILAALAEPVETAAGRLNVSASVGVCLYPQGGGSLETLLQNVDAAMYKAKTAGRNKFAVHHSSGSHELVAELLSSVDAR